jgi:nitrate reductase gamma subunit
MIYLPIFLRFLIGLVLLVLARVFSHSPGIAMLFDKNNPFMAFTYDLLGLCVILGVVGAAMRRSRKESMKALTGGQDVFALVLIAAIFISGFLLEAMGMLMSPPPQGAAYAFVGYPVSLLFALFPVHWESAFSYGWYVHFILTGMFVAYLPFSKMIHILVSPLVLWINSLGNENESTKFLP